MRKQWKQERRKINVKCLSISCTTHMEMVSHLFSHELKKLEDDENDPKILSNIVNI